MKIIPKEKICTDNVQQYFFVLSVTWTTCILLLLCWGLWLEFQHVHFTAIAELHIHSWRWAISLFVIWILVLVLVWQGISAIAKNGRILARVKDELQTSRKESSQKSSVLDSFFSSTPDAIVQVDIREQVEKVNPAFTELTGYSLEKVKGISLNTLFVNSGQSRGFDDIITQQGRERKCKLRNGYIISTDVYGIEVRGDDGEVTGGLVILKDVTCYKAAERDKARLESKLRQASKMEAIGTFAGGIAHDFNNILGIICVNTDMALEDIPENNPARVNINRIIKAASRARNLVKQILAYSRQRDQSLIPLMPGSLVKESLQYLRSITPVSVNIVQNINDDFQAIMMDPAQMQVLLVNLFSRAVNDVHEKGTIEVTGSVVEFVESDAAGQKDILPGRYFRLSVGDKGFVSDGAKQSHAIGPPYTSFKSCESSGKSLETIMDIVKRHDGYITVGNKQGAGSDVEVLFPIVEYEEDQHEEVESLKGTERILFVDDEQMLVEMASMFLQRQGFKVTEKTDSKDALATFRAGSGDFDIVVVDQTMPEMTGSELAVELLKINPDIPIILFTGYSNKTSKEEVADLGIKELLYKPFDGKTLAANIRRVLDG